MKYLFITLIMSSVAFMANVQSCPDQNHPHAIDLGLPSGTKWACCNVGATTPNGYGDYYAWGETEKKESFDWFTYIFCDGTMETCQDIGMDIAGTQYDVAHVQWGGSWVMPSKDQIQELLDNCSYTWTTKNGVEGGLFIGPSGGTIFLPAADTRWNHYNNVLNSNYDGLNRDSDELPKGGYYWASTQNPSNSDYASYLLFSYDNAYYDSYIHRCGGLTIRPVTSTVNEELVPGDLDGNRVIDVEDVNAAINIALKLNAASDYPGNCDMDGNGILDVEDVNILINKILKVE